MNRSILKSLLLLMILVIGATEMDAQRRKTRTRTRVRGEAKEAKPSFTEKLNYEIKIGNVGFNNGFSLSLKPSVGYKFHKYGSGGVGMRSLYSFVNIPGAPDQSFFDFGFFGYGRARLSDNIYLQAEYSTYSLDFPNGRQLITYPLFGGGYVSGIGDWKFGVEVLFIGSEEARDSFGSTIEWWFSASYNF